MSVHRVMGVETEYGISCPQNPGASAVELSGQVVTCYAAQRQHGTGRPRWDYRDEQPLQDARGWQMGRRRADPSQLTDRPDERPDAVELGQDEDPGAANLVLTNGARLYVDHAHPEYSSPEVRTPQDAVRWDVAGERVMAAAAARLAATPGLLPVNLYKNNTDNKGASYGTHENYLMPRQTPFGDVVRGLLPFFVSRQVFAGSGKVGIGQAGEQPGFQLSQRADFFEVEVGLETTLKRPIVNTRDEPHASADRYRRLHVIIGDANLCEPAALLKLGSTALVLSMIEAGAMPDLSLRRPVATLQAVSHDPQLRELVELVDGRRMTAVQLQWLHLEAARAFVDQRDEDDPGGCTADVLARWERVLTRLERDPMLCARELDWVAKLRLLRGFADREQLAWDSPRLALIDLQYSDVRPEKGLYRRLLARDAVDRTTTEDEVVAAVTQPPHDTRAYFRGECLARYGDQVAAASWDSVIFDVPGLPSLQRVPTPDPLRGTRRHVGDLLERCPTARDLVRELTGR